MSNTSMIDKLNGGSVKYLWAIVVLVLIPLLVALSTATYNTAQNNATRLTKVEANYEHIVHTLDRIEKILD